ncbi:hypothetical protein VPH35_129353 [Triticum aestivum]
MTGGPPLLLVPLVGCSYFVFLCESPSSNPLAHMPQPSLPPPLPLSLSGRHNTKPQTLAPSFSLACVLVAAFPPLPHRCANASTGYNGSMADGWVRGSEGRRPRPIA